jgi:DNA polymerase-1
LAVCFDRKEPTFRKEVFDEYQAHRPEMDKDLGKQFPKAKNVLETFNIPVYEKAGFEADDLIGTLAKSLQKKVDEIVIVTGDKDIMQLINSQVRVYMPVRGLSKAKTYDTKEVEKKLKVSPEQIVDYKALVGDSSDNYSGVYGIGPKTAEKLLDKYGDLDTIYENLNEIEKTTRKKLEKDKDNAYLSRKLAKIVTDVDFKFKLEEADKWVINSDEIISLFKEIGFKTLRKRAEKIGKEIERKRQGSLF